MRPGTSVCDLQLLVYGKAMLSTALEESEHKNHPGETKLRQQLACEPPVDFSEMTYITTRVILLGTLMLLLTCSESPPS
eukprot:21961_4